ncbi:hypothetical protein ACHAWF_014542 [Thalassiosira exigua]
MGEIFTSPKHPQHPHTNSKFRDDLVDVSSTNINPPNTDPTMSPTTPPQPIMVYPDNSHMTYLCAGIGGGLGLCLCLFCGCFCYKL